MNQNIYQVVFEGPRIVLWKAHNESWEAVNLGEHTLCMRLVRAILRDGLRTKNEILAHLAQEDEEVWHDQERTD